MHAAVIWTTTLMLLGVFAFGGAGPARAEDPAAGKTVFASQCAICHPAQSGRNMIGPSLFGIVGRKSGSVAGFHYSAANMNAGVVWDEAALDKFLKSPMTVLPGTTMAYAGLPDDTKRAAVVAYLATLK